MNVIALVAAMLTAFAVIGLIESARKYLFFNKLDRRLHEWHHGRRCTCANPRWSDEAAVPGNPFRYCLNCKSFRYDTERQEELLK